MRILPVPICIAILIVAASFLGSATQDPAVKPASLFDVPMKRVEHLKLQQVLVATIAQKNFAGAMQVVQKMTQLEPNEPAGWYNLACLQAVKGDVQPGLESLTNAVRLGFRDVRQLETDVDLKSLRSDAAFEEILKSAKEPFKALETPAVFKPGVIENGVAFVTEQNTRWDASRLSLLTSFEAPAVTKSAAHIVGTSAPEVAVNAWINEGTSAGHYGDLYDNRDRDHSNLNLAKFPLLTHVEYSPEASKAGADWGMRIGQAFEMPTFGNSSTAEVNSPFWRSNPRMLMHEDLLMKLAYNQFVNNQMYCYPEHNDYDSQHGDVYPANTPFWVISQGSSGSDQPFLEAIALTMAAFQPEVKRALIEKRMLMPVVQMLLRRSQRSVQSDDDYFSGKAHPVVFQGSELNPLRMVRMAHDLTLATIPALVRLKVIEEDLGVPGKDYFHPGSAERFFDTPAAIARIYRSTAFQRRMVVDAGDSFELNGQPLTFRWAVLQGNASRVHIRPLTDNASRAEVIVEWQERFPVSGAPGMQTNRIDVGVFAINRTAISLPAFVSTFTLANEKRTYNADRLIQSVDYGDSEVSRRYVDPFIDIPKSWRDDYRYGPDKILLGWTRTAPDQDPQAFSADGRLIFRKDEQQKAVEFRDIQYEAVAAGNQLVMLRAFEKSEAQSPMPLSPKQP